MRTWGFLEPWLPVLREAWTTGVTKAEKSTSVSADSALQVSLISPYPTGEKKRKATDYTVVLYDPIDLVDPERQRHVREGIELLTILSVVDNGAFKELVREYFGEVTTCGLYTVGECTYHVKWQLCIVGTLQADIQFHNQVSWSTLLGFPNNSSTFSDQFWSAMHKLEAMDLKKAEHMYDLKEFVVSWTLKLPVATVCGKLKTQKPADTFSTQLRKLLDAGVPYIVQQIAVRSSVASVATEIQSDIGYAFLNSCLEQSIEEMTVSQFDFAAPEAQDLSVAVVKTAMTHLALNLDDDNMNRQFVKNAGPNLSILASSIGKQEGEAGDLQDQVDSRQAGNVPFAITCYGVSDLMVSPACSAIAELQAVGAINLGLKILTSDPPSPWGWLVYAMCCTTSHTTVRDVVINEASLTKEDLYVIDQVLRTRFPQHSIGSKAETSEYGYLEMQEGTTLLLKNEEEKVVVTTACRRRAVHNTAVLPDAVGVVIPGYGLLWANIGDGANNFIGDILPKTFSQRVHSRCIQDLTIDYLLVEDDSCVFDLLTLIGKGLRKLSLSKLENSPRFRPDEDGLDLSVLAAICPEMDELTLRDFEVSVSEYNEALQNWPVKKMGLHCTARFPPVVQCLSDGKCRMSKELVQIYVTSPVGWPFSDNEIRQMKVHDDELLPLTKEKLPILAKTALLSVVTGRSGTSEIGAFDAYIVSLIFAFASTPVKRLVGCA
ncbi:hypothetical protein PHYPSEUDO_015473 [Phytophthora pseudosyringae]|uniref:Uncharacterized protein n=1 Tax=Phytophthora pseudosyringae TaxID=221518 RepID=A0A8T1VZA0_9STRA|nr:hypothetical protein PHYPSEUDO_015473 [Phytophthora pseudosyringae]